MYKLLLLKFCWLWIRHQVKMRIKSIELWFIDNLPEIMLLFMAQFIDVTKFEVLLNDEQSFVEIVDVLDTKSSSRDLWRWYVIGFDTLFNGKLLIKAKNTNYILYLENNEFHWFDIDNEITYPTSCLIFGNITFPL
jgi:hypothetical protein